MDDVELDESGKGTPILFKNQEIRKMLKLVKAGKNDVFYDLGSGWGQNVIIALTEFNVKKAVGIEKDKERWLRSTLRLERWLKVDPSIKDRGRFVLGDFERIFSDDLEGVDLKEASIVFYGLGTYERLAKNIEKKVRSGTKLIYYDLCLFPEILPNGSDFPFYFSTAPFKKPKSELEWLAAVVQKTKSSIRREQPPDAPELWDELRHDYDVDSLREDVKDYRRRLKKMLSRRQ